MSKHDQALALAEEKIERILSDLEDETGCAIYHIETDTREFARKRIELFLEREGAVLSSQNQTGAK